MTVKAYTGLLAELVRPSELVDSQFYIIQLIINLAYGFIYQ